MTVPQKVDLMWFELFLFVNFGLGSCGLQQFVDYNSCVTMFTINTLKLL